MRTGFRTMAAAAVAALLIAGCTTDDGGEGDGGEGDGAAAQGSAPTATADAVSSASMPVPAGGEVAPSGITVVGSGVATGEPDVVRVMVGVDVRRDDVQQALDDANAATRQVLDVLDEQGIAPEDLQTRDFSVQPFQEPTGNGRIEVTGYQVRNLVEATVRDVDEVGAVLQSVAEAAGDDVSIQGLQFDLEDDGEQVAAAREAALADARAKAEQYAELIGVELGDPVSIDDRTIGTPRSAGAVMDEMAADSAVPIEPGSQNVTVQVTVRWAIG